VYDREKESKRERKDGKKTGKEIESNLMERE
jgi:hypothetical protein